MANDKRGNASATGTGDAGGGARQADDRQGEMMAPSNAGIGASGPDIGTSGSGATDADMGDIDMGNSNLGATDAETPLPDTIMGGDTTRANTTGTNATDVASAGAAPTQWSGNMVAAGDAGVEETDTAAARTDTGGRSKTSDQTYQD